MLIVIGQGIVVHREGAVEAPSSYPGVHQTAGGLAAVNRRRAPAPTGVTSRDRTGFPRGGPRGGLTTHSQDAGTG